MDITTSPYFRKINNGYYLTRRGQIVFGYTDPYKWTATTNSEKLTIEDFCRAMEIAPEKVVHNNVCADNKAKKPIVNGL